MALRHVASVVWRVLRLAVLVYAGIALFAWLGSDRLIFPQPPPSYRDGGDILKLATEDGVEISALHLRNDAARFTILYSHGNYEDLGQLRPYLEQIRDAGFSVFAYDYRGYGTSEGRPTARGTIKDARAAYAYLVDVLKAPPERILVYGRSVGGAMATHLAANERVAGLILESPFVSAFRVKTVVPILPFDVFNNLALMPQVACPVLILHGENDTLIPPWHGQALFDAAKGPKRIVRVPGAGHNDVSDVMGRAYLDELVAFGAGLP